METIRVHSAQASSLRKRLSTFVRSFISAEQIPHWSQSAMLVKRCSSPKYGSLGRCIS